MIVVVIVVDVTLFIFAIVVVVIALFIVGIIVVVITPSQYRVSIGCGGFVLLWDASICYYV